MIAYYVDRNSSRRKYCLVSYLISVDLIFVALISVELLFVALISVDLLLGRTFRGHQPLRLSRQTRHSHAQGHQGHFSNQIFFKLVHYTSKIVVLLNQTNKNVFDRIILTSNIQQGNKSFKRTIPLDVF